MHIGHVITTTDRAEPGTQKKENKMNTATQENRVAITGNTYPVKDALKALGARWNADAKAWMVTADKAKEAQAIVAGAGPKKAYTAASPSPYWNGTRSGGAGRRTGCSCGSRENYSQPSDCRSCKFDQDDN